MTLPTPSSQVSPPDDILLPPPAEFHFESARQVRSSSGSEMQFVVRYGESRLVQLSQTAMWLLKAARDELPVEDLAAQLTDRAGKTVSGADIHRHYHSVLTRLDAIRATPPSRRGLRTFIPAEHTGTAGRFLLPLFQPWAVVMATAVSLGLIVTAARTGLSMTDHGGLAVSYALLLLAVVGHELGHAAAAVFHGARPGDVRVAVGMTGPHFCTDVTDTWRLPKGCRVAVCLGGAYVQAVFAGLYAALYLVTGWPVMASAMVLTGVSLAVCLVPMRASDGAWAIADLLDQRYPAGRNAQEAPLKGLGRAGYVYTAAGWIIYALAAGLLLTQVPLATDLPAVFRQVWSGQGSGIPAFVFVQMVIIFAGPLGDMAVRRISRRLRGVENKRVPPPRAHAVPRSCRVAADRPGPITAVARPLRQPASVLPPDKAAIQRVDEVLKRFLEEKEAVLREVDEDCSELMTPLTRMLLDGGKRLRPLFCYWGWRGAGRPEHDGLFAAAAAFEMLHGGALIHDDVMDDSDTRRGLPAIHRSFEIGHRRSGWHGDAAKFGTTAAILLGDLCLSWSDDLLSRSDVAERRLTQARRLFQQTRTELVGGQYLDVRSQASGAADLRRARQVIRYKTAKYTIERPLQIGGVLAGASPQLLGAYSAYALPLGEAFQLRDDVLGVFGDPSTTGKPVGDDLREGKRTVLISLAVQGGDARQRAAIGGLLGRADLDEAGVDRIREVIVDTGALDRVEKMITKQVAEALAALEGFPRHDPELVQALRHLALRVSARAD